MWPIAFQSTLPTRGSDRFRRASWAMSAYFNPRSPRGGATKEFYICPREDFISIHAPHEGERQYRTGYLEIAKKFQSTLPTRGSDPLSKASMPPKSHFNPRSPRGGATNTEGECPYKGVYFNPRSPRGGATTMMCRLFRRTKISIHAPHEGERQNTAVPLLSRSRISIHAPHEGERQSLSFAYSRTELFQSTLPTRGSDFACGRRGNRKENFNPRSPRGGATHLSLLAAPKGGFQSTLPTRGSDRVLTFGIALYSHFNPRSPRGGATEAAQGMKGSILYFNPRSPRGGATRLSRGSGRGRKISIHAPHEGERPFLLHNFIFWYIFQSTLPTRGSDPLAESVYGRCTHFNPRSPRGGATPTRQR